MKTSCEPDPGLRRDDVNDCRRHPDENRGPVAVGVSHVIRYILLGSLITCVIKSGGSEAASTGTFHEQMNCDPLCQIKLMQDDLDKNDVQTAFRKFETFHATYPGNQEINPICDQFYQRQSSSQALTADQFGFLLRSACGTHKSPDDILWEKGKALFEQHDYLNAERYFQRIIESYPNSKYRSDASAYKAQCKAQQDQSKK